MMHRGRVVLDPDNHEIKDFPELPKILSSELEGRDIEYYMRKNMAIGNGEMSYYDIRGKPSSFLYRVSLTRFYSADAFNIPQRQQEIDDLVCSEGQRFEHARI